jgi:hypothetical protein
MTVAQAKKYVRQPKPGNGASPLYQPVSDTRLPKRARMGDVEDTAGSSVHLPPPSTGKEKIYSLSATVAMGIIRYCIRWKKRGKTIVRPAHIRQL